MRYKITGSLVFVICLTILLASMDQTLMNKLKQDRYFDHLTPNGQSQNSWYHRLFIRSDRWRYGDLYGLSFLPDYKLPLDPFTKYSKKGTAKASGKILFIIGDSFLADKTLNGAFEGFDEVVFLDRRFPFGPIALDSMKQNYLVMEFAERNLVDYNINKTFEAKWSPSDVQAGKNFRPSVQEPTTVHIPTSLWERVNNTIFNKNLSRNLELLLFDDKAFTPVKELKATINYKLFDRVDKDVSVSTDKTRLLMNLTVDTGSKLSDFRPVPDKEIQTLVRNLDAANKYYRSIGFKKVILTVVPNPVTIYDEKRMAYNHLLQRVESENRFPIVDIYSSFKKANYNLYYRSDTHWNPKGLDLWIHEMNNSIKNW